MAKASKRSVKINMDGVEAGGLVPEGDYNVEVSEVTVAESDAGKQYLKWVFEISDGKNKGGKLYHNTSLQPQALFNLKGVLIALGMEVPNDLALDLDDLEGRQMGVTVEHEMYEGKKKSRITETFPLEGAEDEDDDSEVDLSTLDLDELIEYAAENDIDLSGLKAKDKKNKAKVLAVIEAAQPEEEEDEPEESDESEDDAPDFGSMNLKELKAYATENDIEIPKAIIKNVEKIRELIAASVEDEGVELDDMDLDELTAFAAEQGIKIPAKIKKKEDAIRELIAAEMGTEEEENEEVDLDSMDLKALISYAAENDIPLSKKAKASDKLARKVIAAAMEDDED